MIQSNYERMIVDHIKLTFSKSESKFENPNWHTFRKRESSFGDPNWQDGHYLTKETLSSYDNGKENKIYRVSCFRLLLHTNQSPQAHILAQHISLNVFLLNTWYCHLVSNGNKKVKTTEKKSFYPTINLQSDRILYINYVI